MPREEALLGKRVRVTLCDDEFEKVVTEGVFLGFSEGGSVEVREDDGFIHYSWPMLKIEEVENA